MGREPYRGFRHVVRVSDSLPRSIARLDPAGERNLWFAAIHQCKCKCEYCVWGKFLELQAKFLRARSNARLARERELRGYDPEEAEDDAA